jgi:SAM-dependent methyltransferase
VAVALAALVGLGFLRKLRSDFRPVMMALDLLPQQPRSAIRKLVFRLLYQSVSQTSGDYNSFLNYGYADLDGVTNTVDLPAALEEDRVGIQLYHHLASSTDLVGLDVLEVGSGRGGGAAFVFERHKPASLIGLDLALAAVDRANELYREPGLWFEPGDAERLPFPDARFDVVLNVESSHCYPSVPTFLDEVFRVLRPGGHLVLADLRGADDLDLFREQILDAGFVLEEEEDITDNVVTALRLDSPRRLAMIRETGPAVFRPFNTAFAGVEGSNIYNQFASRELIYTRFLARR